jgi:hypothetical protein
MVSCTILNFCVVNNLFYFLLFSTICHVTLAKLTYSCSQNPAFYCTRCNVEFDPESENVRRESKLSVPDRNIEPVAATTRGTEYLNKQIEIHKEPELHGGFAELARKCIKIKDYKERMTIIARY